MFFLTIQCQNNALLPNTYNLANIFEDKSTLMQQKAQAIVLYLRKILRAIKQKNDAYLSEKVVI